MLAYRRCVLLTTAALAGLACTAFAQLPSARTTTPSSGSPPATGSGWRAPADSPSSPATAASTAQAGTTLQPVAPIRRKSIAKVSSGNGTLPNEDGQVWREYDISPYTLRVTSTNRPEQAIIDWILRETGYEAWHGTPVAVLSADNRTLRVYHTQQMQDLVSEIVDRFVNSEAETQAFGMRIISVGSPNWRAKAQRSLRPIPIESPGAQAWLLAKEDAALLIAELRKRTDFREHSSPHLLVHNGQTTTVAVTRPRNYIKDVLLRADTWPGFELQAGGVSEGFSLELNPLLSVDGNSIDAIVKCSIDQVEKLVPVVLDVPTTVAPRQRTQMEVPQMVSTRLHERFRWPTDQVLLVSLGVVPTPVPIDPAIRLPLLDGGPDRADLLVFIESKGPMTPSTAPAATTAQGGAPLPGATQRYHGRY